MPASVSPGAERNRQVLARGDEVRELDWRLYSDPRRSSPSRHLLTKDQFRFAAESVVPLPLSSSGATRARPDVARSGEIGPSGLW